MKHKIKRLLSLLLSLTMLTAALPTSIWAEETGVAQATGAEAEFPNEPEATAEPELPVELPEATDEPEFPSEPTKLPSYNSPSTSSAVSSTSENTRVFSVTRTNMPA